MTSRFSTVSAAVSAAVSAVVSVDTRPDGRDSGAGSGRRRAGALELVGLVAVLFFALASIGAPLWGGSVLAATDELSTHSPYYDAGMAGLPVQNTFMDDTYDSVMPDTILFTEQARAGNLAAWNPYVMGGVPLGATPTLALASPLSLPWYLLPARWAPGYVKLVETLFAAGMTFLFLRRLRLGRPAALLGGLVFGASAFMVVWTNWPHTRTAAFIPAVFWALERLIQRRTARDTALLALAVGGMLAGGFPAVTAFTLYTAAPYLLVRVLASYRGQWRRITGVIAAAGAGVLTGVALLAVQLAPFVRNLSNALIEGRAQTGGAHLDPASLVTALSPWALGTVDPSRPPFWYLRTNLVESMMYVGAAALVLIVVALATPWAARRFLPPGVWAVLVSAAAAWLVILYTGAVVAAHQLPVFATNFVGRGRSVLGLLLAVLAAVGLEILLRRRVTRAEETGIATPRHRRRTWYAAAVWITFAGTGALVAYLAHSAAAHAAGSPAQHAQRVAHLDRALLVGGALLAVAALAAALLWWGPPRRGTWAAVRVSAAAALPLLAAGQAVSFAAPYYPRVDPDTFFPVTATQSYLMAHLGHDRFAGTTAAMVRGADAQLRLRALGGHAFVDRAWADLVDGLPGRQFGWPTVVTVPASAGIATSPVLDQVSVRYLVTSPRDPVFGVRHPAVSGTGTVALTGGKPLRATLRTPGPLRAVSITPVGPLPPLAPKSAVEVVLDGPDGREIARSRRLVAGMAPGSPFDIPVAAEQVPPGTTLTARFTLLPGAAVATPVRLRVAAAPGGAQPAAGTVVDGGDGLRLVQATPSVVWERLTALPRIRWASHVRVEHDPRRQVQLISAGAVGRDTVVLGSADAPADGRPATVTIIKDGSDEIKVRVDADGAGYLVVADAIADTWRASVDGTGADLVAADRGLAAVAVPAGVHTIRIHYVQPYGNAGGWISSLTALTLVVLLVGRRRWGRHPHRRAPGRIERKSPDHDRPSRLTRWKK